MSSQTTGSEQSKEHKYDRKYIPPWKEPYVIALAGSSGSGKTSIAQSIIKRINVSIKLWII